MKKVDKLMADVSSHFQVPGTSDNITNHLVEIVYEGKKYYDWMPMHEAQTVGCKDINDTYVKKLTLK